MFLYANRFTMQLNDIPCHMRGTASLATCVAPRETLIPLPEWIRQQIASDNPT